MDEMISLNRFFEVSHGPATAGYRIGLQLQQTALTVNAIPQYPDARMLPNPGAPSCLLAAAGPY